MPSMLSTSRKFRPVDVTDSSTSCGFSTASLAHCSPFRRTLGQCGRMVRMLTADRISGSLPGCSVHEDPFAP